MSLCYVTAEDYAKHWGAPPALRIVRGHMTTALNKSDTTIDPAVIERVIIHGDLRQLTPAQKVAYYKSVCESLGLNPLTQPFQYIVLSGKEVLYARREATEQLRQMHSISIDPKTFSREVIEGCYVVTAPASMPNGRTDVSTGVVPIDGLKGEARANAMMKAETKAKRRVTLSICGLGMLDETEVQSIQDDGPKGYVVQAPGTLPARAAGGAIEDTSAPNVGGFGQPVSAGYGVTEHGEVIPADGLLYISRVDTTPTKNQNVKKTLVTFSNAEQASTIKPQLASLAEQCCQECCPVTYETKATKFGLDLVVLKRADRKPVAAEVAPMLTESDIPF